MKCKDYCKHFTNQGIGATFAKCEVIYYGSCKKYGIQVDTNKECLDTLPYHEK